MILGMILCSRKAQLSMIEKATKSRESATISMEIATIFRENAIISTKTQFEVEVSVIPFWYQKNWQIPLIYCIIQSEDEKENFRLNKFV